MSCPSLRPFAFPLPALTLPDDLAAAEHLAVAAPLRRSAGRRPHQLHVAPPAAPPGHRSPAMHERHVTSVSAAYWPRRTVATLARGSVSVVSPQMVRPDTVAVVSRHAPCTLHARSIKSVVVMFPVSVPSFRVATRRGRAVKPKRSGLPPTYPNRNRIGGPPPGEGTRTAACAGRWAPDRLQNGSPDRRFRTARSTARFRALFIARLTRGSMSRAIERQTLRPRFPPSNSHNTRSP